MSVKAKMRMRIARTHVAVSVAMVVSWSAGTAQVAQVELKPSVSTVNSATVVALEGGEAFVNAPRYNSWNGAVFVFEESGGVWTQSAILEPPPSLATMSFAATFEVDGSWLAIAAYGTTLPAPGGMHSGIVLMYERTPLGWSYHSFIQSNSPAAQDNFGNALALDGDSLLVHARKGQGRVESFRLQGGVWAFEESISASPTSVLFGRTLALDGDLAAIQDIRVGGDAVVRVYTRSSGTWVQSTSLFGSGAATDDVFGSAVCVQGDRVVCGNPNEDSTASEAGATYVFLDVGGVWIEEARLLASDAQVGDHFGVEVALDGHTLLIGAPDRSYLPHQPNHGKAYSFRLSGMPPLAAWIEETSFDPPSTSPPGKYGSCIDLELRRGVINMPYSVSPLPGRAFALELPQDAATYCTAKVNSLGCVPAIGWAGTPSATGTDDFHASASAVRNGKAGILIWSFTPNSVPFFGGTLCVAPQITRTPAQLAGGSPPPASDCSGAYDFHWSHSYMTSKSIGPGSTVYCQWWSRDQGFPAPNNVGLTDGLRFVVGP